MDLTSIVYHTATDRYVFCFSMEWNGKNMLYSFRFSWIKDGYGGNESNFTYISRQPSQINSYLEFITLFFVVGLVSSRRNSSLS